MSTHSQKWHRLTIQFDADYHLPFSAQASETINGELNPNR